MTERATLRLATSWHTNRDGCWLWHRKLDRGGYGLFFMDGKWQRAHRVSYLIFKGKIPDSLVIDHLCKVKACINPEHLEAVTQRENILRDDYRGTDTHCKFGHERRGLISKCYDCTNERNRKRYATDLEYRKRKLKN